MGITPSTCRWSPTPVKEEDIYIVLFRHTGEVLLGAVDVPVGRHITSVFRTVGESKHNGLLISSTLQMGAVVFI